MAISADLKEIYSNYDDTRRFYDTVQLYHPNFKVASATAYPSDDSYPSETEYPSEIDYTAQSFFLVRDDIDHDFQIADLSTQTFSAYPFNIIQPQVGEDQQDIGIVLDNVSLELLENIETAALNQSVPIQMTFSVYMDGDATSQITPIQLALTDIVVDMFTVSCKASRTDLFNRRFPFGENTYFDSKFKGLTV